MKKQFLRSGLSFYCSAPCATVLQHVSILNYPPNSFTRGRLPILEKLAATEIGMPGRHNYARYAYLFTRVQLKPRTNTLQRTGTQVRPKSHVRLACRISTTLN